MLLCVFCAALMYFASYYFELGISDLWPEVHQPGMESKEHNTIQDHVMLDTNDENFSRLEFYDWGIREKNVSSRFDRSKIKLSEKARIQGRFKLGATRNFTISNKTSSNNKTSINRDG